MVVYPDVASIQEAFPNITADKLGQDLAYSAMLTKLPTGLLGIVLASLVAAYMSTISTQLNWGSSYIVYDFYKQQINPNATEKQMVNAGRISTVVLMVLSAFLALALQNAMGVFNLLLSFGAGTGLIFILRWFWWRINAWTEIAAMFSSGILAILLETTPLKAFLFGTETGLMPDWAEMPFIMLVTSIVWLTATFMTQPETNKVLQNFHKKIQPGGPGWRKIVDEAANNGREVVLTTEKWAVPSGLKAMLLGVVLIYTIMFATGYWIYGETNLALVLTASALVAGLLLVKVWNKMKKVIL